MIYDLVKHTVLLVDIKLCLKDRTGNNEWIFRAVKLLELSVIASFKKLPYIRISLAMPIKFRRENYEATFEVVSSDVVVD